MKTNKKPRIYITVNRTLGLRSGESPPRRSLPPDELHLSIISFLFYKQNLVSSDQNEVTSWNFTVWWILSHQWIYPCPSACPAPADLLPPLQYHPSATVTHKFHFLHFEFLPSSLLLGLLFHSTGRMYVFVPLQCSLS